MTQKEYEYYRLEGPRQYIRDGRSPIPKKEATSKVMSANKAKDTKPEIKFRKALWSHNIKGYRLHWKKAPGRPDIAFPGKKVAIFINGCFWHRCPHCKLAVPKSNSIFWNEKFSKNVARDKAKVEILLQNNWKVLIVWECELGSKMSRLIKETKSLLTKDNSFHY